MFNNYVPPTPPALIQYEVTDEELFLSADEKFSITNELRSYEKLVNSDPGAFSFTDRRKILKEIKDLLWDIVKEYVSDREEAKKRMSAIRDILEKGRGMGRRVGWAPILSLGVGNRTDPTIPMTPNFRKNSNRGNY